MKLINFENVTSGIIGGVVSAIIVGIWVLRLRLSKRWSRGRQLKSKMREALRKCRTKTIRFKNYDDSDLAKHFDDVGLENHPYNKWLNFDEDGREQRSNSDVGKNTKR